MVSVPITQLPSLVTLITGPLLRLNESSFTPDTVSLLDRQQRFGFAADFVERVRKEANSAVARFESINLGNGPLLRTLLAGNVCGHVTLPLRQFVCTSLASVLCLDILMYVSNAMESSAGPLVLKPQPRNAERPVISQDLAGKLDRASAWFEVLQTCSRRWTGDEAAKELMRVANSADTKRQSHYLKWLYGSTSESSTLGVRAKVVMAVRDVGFALGLLLQHQGNLAAPQLTVSDYVQRCGFSAAFLSPSKLCTDHLDLTRWYFGSQITPEKGRQRSTVASVLCH
ncbi:hypothetical protein B0H10DRAFT_2099614 [Mycena sp. CBHHK59/15]|nr:hypothetical protein B0H10DRAFT_2099614 [Mycena sp. CBHHK59/15]